MADQDQTGQPQERETIDLSVGGKSFSLDAPKGLSDEEVLRRAIRADPEFATLAKTHPKLAGLAAQEQAHAKSKILPPPQFDALSNAMTPFPKNVGRMGDDTDVDPEGAALAVRTMTEAGLGAEAGGLVKAGGALGLLGRGAMRGAGTAVGSMAGDVANLEKPDPKAAGWKGLEAGIASVVGDTVIAGGSALLRPWLMKAPEALIPATEAEISAGIRSRAYDAVDLARTEEGLRKSIVGAPSAIRKNIINPAYPKIQGTVDIYAPAKATLTEGAKQIASGTPAELARTAAIGKQIGALEGTLKEALTQDRSLAGDSMQQAEVLDTLQAIQDKRQISFSQAQNLRSALGRLIAKGQGYKLPAEVFSTVRNVYGLLDDAMQSTAASEGKLGEWQAAQKLYKRFMDDFYNKNAPLKGILDLKEGMTGRTLKKLDDPDTANRAIDALRRYGLNDQANALRKVLDNPGRKDAIEDMERITVSPKAFFEERVAEARKVDAAKVEASQRTRAAAQKEISQARREQIRTGLLTVGVGGGGTGIGKWLFGRRATIPEPPVAPPEP
jgi:hypothetical protein